MNKSTSPDSVIRFLLGAVCAVVAIIFFFLDTVAAWILTDTLAAWFVRNRETMGFKCTVMLIPILALGLFLYVLLKRNRKDNEAEET
jgi:hypothetical protein